MPLFTNPTTTTTTTPLDWLLAKMYVQNSGANLHQIISHAMKTHLIATIPRRAGQRFAADARIALIELPFDAKAWTMAMISPEVTARDPGLIWLRGQILDAVDRCQ